MSTRPLFPPGPSTSPHRPSLFELLAQEQLRDLLHPIVRYVLAYFTQRYPRYLIRVLNHHEEFFACLLLVLERHHLKKHNASLSEHFYQLRLVHDGGMPTPRLALLEPSQTISRPLSRRQRWGLLVFLVGLPYARARTQDYFERLNQEDAADSTTKSLFKTVYPYLNLGLDLGLLGHDIAYLFEKTDSYRPWHRWLGVRVERRAEPAPESPWLSLPPLLPPLLLLLKLGQWWYSPSSPRAISSSTNNVSTSRTHASILPPRPLPILPSGLPTPPSSPPVPSDQISPPPPRDTVGDRPQGMSAVEYTVTPESFGKCPLCARPWQNPAVLPTGWVVCWRCGWDAIQDESDDSESGTEPGDPGARPGSGSGLESGSKGGRKGTCPMTGARVLPRELRRVLV